MRRGIYTLLQDLFYCCFRIGVIEEVEVLFMKDTDDIVDASLITRDTGETGILEE